MAEYSLTTPTLVPEGGTIPYNNVICKGCCNVRRRGGSGVIKLKGGTCCDPARYYVQFHANLTGVAGEMQVGLFLDGELLPETLMSVVAAAATDVLSVDAATEICLDWCCSSLSARVITGDTVTVNTANIIIHKEN